MSDAERGSEDSLATQHDRLASLQSCEERIRELRDRECDREVEHMAAEAAFHSATNRLHPRVDRLAAVRIGQLLENRHALQDRLRDVEAHRGNAGTGSGRTADQLRAAHAALLAWLDAGSPEQPGPAARYGKVVLLLASLGILWLSFAVHPAFLLLLVVILGPVSFAMGRGQDGQWRRVGAKRRYDGSGLADFGEWNEQSVRARADELETLMARKGDSAPSDVRGEPPQEPDNAETLAARIAELDHRVTAELGDAGLSPGDVEGELGEWLRLAARADGARRALEQVKRERRRLRDEAVELREQLGRYLRSRGIRPTAEQDTAADIAERLDDLHASRGNHR